MEPIVRRALPEEAEALSALALKSKAHWPYPKDYLEKCREALRVDPEYVLGWPVFVADVAGKPAGFFALKVVSGEPRLDHLWIAPELIGKGIGRILFGRAVEEARRLGWSSFRLAADPYATDFYAKLGCVRIGEVQSRIKPDLFLPHMEKRFQ